MRLDAETAERLGLAALVLVASTAASTAIVVAFLVRIPPGHFLGGQDGTARRFRSPAARAAYLVGKNLLGLALLGAGALMALPGIPGQGLLTMLVGLFLLDVPGKRRLELAIVRRRAVLAAVNRIRSRFGQPPLLVDGAREDPSA